MTGGRPSHASPGQAGSAVPPARSPSARSSWPPPAPRHGRHHRRSLPPPGEAPMRDLANAAPVHHQPPCEENSREGGSSRATPKGDKSSVGGCPRWRFWSACYRFKPPMPRLDAARRALVHSGRPAVVMPLQQRALSSGVFRTPEPAGFCSPADVFSAQTLSASVDCAGAAATAWPHVQPLISGMSSPCRQIYSLCSMSLSRIACLA